MTYTTVDELPEGVRKSLSRNDCVEWMNAYNLYFAQLNSGDLIVPDGYPSAEMFCRECAWRDCRYLESSRFTEVVVSVEMVDKEGDLADVDAYVSEGQDFVNEGGVGLGDHTNKPITTIWKVYKGIDSETQLPCVVACLNFFRGRTLYDEAWSRFLSGKTQWSIGSLTRKTRECNTERCYFRLIPDQWFELSNVYMGLNPRTYVVDYNESAKGAKGIIDIHGDVCPILQRYEEFKKSLAEMVNLTANIIEGGTVLVHGEDVDSAEEIIKGAYPESSIYKISKGELLDEDCILIVPQPIDDSDEMMESMIALIKDEQSAITGYNTVMDSLIMGSYLESPEIYEKVSKIFSEIIHDEQNHIGAVIEAIRTISPEIGENIASGMKEAVDESKKGCPVGQHQHAGVWGCHDVFREHHFDHSSPGTDKLDLTDEDIDINAIKDMPTDKLRMLVVKVAKTLTKYDDDARQRFLASTPGKEFVVMFLELKERGKGQESSMTEKEAGCKGEVPEEAISEEVKGDEPKISDEEVAVEAEKGSPPDVLTSIANISSTLASITAVIDQINIRMMKVEEFMAASTENKSDITDAILSGVDVAGAGVMGGGAPVPAGNTVGADDAGVENKAVEPDGDENGGVADGSHPEPDGDEPKGEEESKDEGEPGEDKDKDEEGESEDKEEGGESEGDDKKEESKEETKDEDSEEKEESKEEVKTEDDGDKKEKKEEKTEFFEKKKGKSVKGVPTEEAVEPVEEVPKADEPIAEVAEPVEKAPEGEPDVEPIAEVGGDVEIAPAVAPMADAPVAGGNDAFMPPGGGVDFKTAWAKRQAELKQKGVDMTLQEAGGMSLASVTPSVGTNQSNVKLIEPSTRIGVFDGGVDGVSAKDILKSMGSNPANFLQNFRRN